MAKQEYKDVVKISMTIKIETYKRFKEYCRKHGMKISTKVNALMEEEISKESTLKRW